MSYFWIKTKEESLSYRDNLSLEIKVLLSQLTGGHPNHRALKLYGPLLRSSTKMSPMVAINKHFHDKCLQLSQREQNHDSDNVPDVSWKYLSHVLNVVHAALLLVELPQGAVAVKFPTKIHVASVNRVFWSRVLQLKPNIHHHFTSLFCRRSQSER